MKSWLAALLVGAIGLGAPLTALAQHGAWGQGRGGPGHWSPPPRAARREDRHGGPPASWPGPAAAYGRYDYRPPAERYLPPRPPSARYAPTYYPPRYAPPALGRWRRGDILPPSYRGYPIADYQRFHLRRPPRGYYWCRDGGEFMLIAAASGLIFEVIGDD